MGDPEADFCTFLDLALLIAPALPDAAMQPLFKATALAAGVPHAAAQKKAYKALATLAVTRPAILRQHLAQVRVSGLYPYWVGVRRAYRGLPTVLL